MATVNKIKLGSLDAVEIVQNSSKASIKVALYGGTLYSYVGSDGKERLLLSEKSVLDGTKPIRGGVPLVFPVFGPDEKKIQPNHGFARISMWEMVEEVKEVQDGMIQVAFRLGPNEKSKELWPFEFALTHQVTFGPNVLQTRMLVQNPGSTDFEFQTLLHTYYLLDDISSTKISGGFTKSEYIDKLQDAKVLQEDRDPITFQAETDAIYKDITSPIVVESGSTKFQVQVELHCNDEKKPCDTVLWNPWIQKSKNMGDFGDEEFHKMVCVEPGCVSRFEKCAPGQTWSLTQSISFL